MAYSLSPKKSVEVENDYICTKSSPQHAPLDLRFHPVDSGHLGSKDHGVVLRGRFDIIVRECWDNYAVILDMSNHNPLT